MSNKRYAAIIIAAGFASRMGSFKPLLPIGSKNAIDHAIAAFSDLEIDPIIVVTGHNSDTLTDYLTNKPVTCIHNSNFEKGMFTSIQAGVEALPKNISGFFIHLADIPLVKQDTITLLKAAFEQNTCKIVYPSINYKKGHPPLLSKKLIDPILNHNGDGGLKKLLSLFNDDAIYVTVDDPGILMDMDTPEAYKNIQEYYKKHGGF
jgi:CTP:molybdopterin cytidylyltransferase MocA